jgi:hypothetical protein
MYYYREEFKLIAVCIKYKQKLKNYIGIYKNRSLNSPCITYYANFFQIKYYLRIKVNQKKNSFGSF